MPEPLGTSVHRNAFVDAALAGELATGLSHSGPFINAHMASVIWLCKRRERDTSGPQFVATWSLIQILIDLRFYTSTP